MNDLSGFQRTLRAIARQLAALPTAQYELRLIEATSRQCRAARIWCAGTLTSPAAVSFLRARNREGCDIYFRPWTPGTNAGYVLLDFDAAPCPLGRMRSAGQEPAVVVQTSPGHQQAWLCVGTRPAEPATATAIARTLASRYGADPASADWRHLGRLAGFTNRKPERAGRSGMPPWVRIVWTAVAPSVTGAVCGAAAPEPPAMAPCNTGFAVPAGTYREWLRHAGVYAPVTDWSAADYRVACALLRSGAPPEAAMAVLREGSPGFPRRHGNPSDYLERTVRRAAAEVNAIRAFSAAPEL